MDTVVLAGGLGTRMREETEYRPKPMVEVGNRPVLWHLLRNLACFGLRDFRIATGYKSEVIQDYFLNFGARTRDVQVTLGNPATVEYLTPHDVENWRVSLIDTGLMSTTAERVLRIADRVALSDEFLVVYGDGLANVDISTLKERHAASGKLATVTLVRNRSRFGIVDLSPDGMVTHFTEKPVVDDFISIGFIVFKRDALAYFQEGESLEDGPLARLAADGELSGYVHEGFWEPMDTYREYLHLNQLWDSGEAPWRQWD